MPDRLVADRVRAVRLDRETHEPQGRCAIAPRRIVCVAPDEIGLAPIDEPLETRLLGPVDGAVLAGPGPKTLFEPQGIERPAAHAAQAERLPRPDRGRVEGALVVGPAPAKARRSWFTERPWKVITSRMLTTSP